MIFALGAEVSQNGPACSQCSVITVGGSLPYLVPDFRMRLTGHVARIGEDRGVHRELVGKPEGKSHWGDQDGDGRIILRWIFRKLEGVVGTGWSWLRIGTGGGHVWVR